MSNTSSRQVRCAIYTRKSSEEGLDQAFNSLDAQREAGVDYIKSQRHQGWVVVKTGYDDGGYSGGSTDRPGLQALLGDIQKRRVDIVLVYKVDRLSRSLSDFARLMQVFDQHAVSFVSVTQQFNTTTSMGRLTLNMLLSFAQFEREVTGERIRDKIAATKKKSIWVGGRPPIGYRLPKSGDQGVAPGDRTLLVVDTEAVTVREIYSHYLVVRSPLQVAKKLNAAGQFPARSGGKTAPRPFTAHDIDRILTNPIYIGKITHARRTTEHGGGGVGDKVIQVYDGTHAPIIDDATWRHVRAAMDQEETARRHRWTHTHLLKGKLKTFEGFAMSPGSVHKSPARGASGNPGSRAGQKRQVRYYISQKAIKQGYDQCPIKNVNAELIDDLVRALVVGYLSRAESIDLSTLEPVACDALIRRVVQRVIIAPDNVTTELDAEELVACRVAANGSRQMRAASNGDRVAPVCPFVPRVEPGERGPILSLDIQIRRHDGRRLLVGPDGSDLLTSIGADGAPLPRDHIVHAIGLAYTWRQELLKSGESLSQLGERHGCTGSHIHHLLALTNLAPDIIAQAVTGTLPSTVSLQDLRVAGRHMKWGAQRETLGVSRR